jgi:hypothetical protein
MKLEFKQWFIPNIGVVPVDPETPLVLEVEKKWVNLTNAEIDELHGSPMALEHSSELKWVRAIELKLKLNNEKI